MVLIELVWHQEAGGPVSSVDAAEPPSGIVAYAVRTPIAIKHTLE
jgi:hypothetical protein